MTGQGQKLTTSQSLVQKQVLTQKLIQSINLMAMPLTELRETISQEAEKNPALEVLREAGEMDEAVLFPQSQSGEDQNTETGYFSNSSDPGYQPVSQSDPNSKQRFLEGAIFRQESLHDHLLNQMKVMTLDSETAKLAEKIIWNLDEDGFNLENPKLLAENTSGKILEKALNTVRRLEPLGCACCGWKESLLVQTSIRGDGPENFDLFVNEALPLMERKHPEEVRHKLKISKAQWEDWEEYIRFLDPFPGRGFSNQQPQYIYPDLTVRKEEGEYVIILNDEILPVLRLDPSFEAIKDNAEGNPEAQRFISDHSRDARYFINSLAQRDNTLLKTAKAIVEFQRDFFSGGPRNLKPLTLKNVADEIGVHEATVSRITTNKYVQTDWGLFELKYFFTNSISGSGSSGSRVSKVAAKEVIKEILGAADPSQRISDQKLADLLARRGIVLARRTVAKYRKELDLPSSYNR